MYYKKQPVRFLIADILNLPPNVTNIVRKRPLPRQFSPPAFIIIHKTNGKQVFFTLIFKTEIELLIRSGSLDDSRILTSKRPLYWLCINGEKIAAKALGGGGALCHPPPYSTQQHMFCTQTANVTGAPRFCAARTAPQDT